jgi:integrase
MPRKVDGWFDHKRRRWMIEYTPVRCGRRHKITRSIHQLREQFGWAEVPDTEVGSLKFWRLWWSERKRELDDAARPATRPPYPMEDIGEAVFGAGFTLLPEDPSEPGVRDEIRPEHAHRLIRDAVLEVVERYLLEGRPLPSDVSASLSDSKKRQLEAVGRMLRDEGAEPGVQNLRQAVDAWLTHLRGEVGIGKISPVRYNAYAKALEAFLLFADEKTPLTHVNGEMLSGYYNYCRRKIAEQREGRPGWSVKTATERMKAAKAFIRYYVEAGAIAAPVNLGKRFTFGSALKRPRVWSVEEIKTAMPLANERFQLFMLLALNCGFTQIDLATLRNDQIDTAGGYITRQRNKAQSGGYKDAPTVCWKLWPATLAFLMKYRTPHGDIALRGQRGAVLVQEKVGRERTDRVKSMYGRLRKKLRATMPGFDRSFKDLRKTSSVRAWARHSSPPSSETAAGGSIGRLPILLGASGSKSSFVRPSCLRTALSHSRRFLRASSSFPRGAQTKQFNSTCPLLPRPISRDGRWSGCSGCGHRAFHCRCPLRRTSSHRAKTRRRCGGTFAVVPVSRGASSCPSS